MNCKMCGSQWIEIGENNSGCRCPFCGYSESKGNSPGSGQNYASFLRENTISKAQKDEYIRKAQRAHANDTIKSGISSICKEIREMSLFAAKNGKRSAKYEQRFYISEYEPYYKEVITAIKDGVYDELRADGYLSVKVEIDWKKRYIFKDIITTVSW